MGGGENFEVAASCAFCWQFCYYCCLFLVCVRACVSVCVCVFILYSWYFNRVIMQKTPLLRKPLLLGYFSVKYIDHRLLR